jgi:hypothetical protein
MEPDLHYFLRPSLPLVYHQVHSLQHPPPRFPVVERRQLGLGLPKSSHRLLEESFSLVSMITMIKILVAILYQWWPTEVYLFLRIQKDFIPSHISYHLAHS